MSAELPGEQMPYWDRSTDVVVVGGGGAGMAAAVSAAETDPGAEVLLIQKLSELGGTTTMAVGSFTAAETPLQEAAGIRDSVDHHYEDIGRFVRHYSDNPDQTGYAPYQGSLVEKEDRELRRLLVENAAETLEWLRGWGCEYVGPYPEKFHRVPRIHAIVPDGTAYADHLGDALAELDVAVQFDTEVTDLVTDGDAVTGVITEHDGSDRAAIRARRGVVLATGDYVGDPDTGDESRADRGAEPINEHNTGDGHRMARDAGATLLNMDLQSRGLRFGSPLYTAPHVASFTDAGALIVDGSGERFVNEDCDFRQLFESTVSQADQLIYLVFDDAIAEEFQAWPDPVSTFHGKGWGYLEDYRPHDVYHTAGTLTGLADSVGFPSAFTNTVTDYNDCVEAGEIDRYGRTIGLRTLSTAPFHALGPIHAYATLTDGGVSTSEEMEVLTDDGRTIEGLYAAGAVVGGIVSRGHGHRHALLFTTGKLAGRNATDQ